MAVGRVFRSDQERVFASLGIVVAMLVGLSLPDVAAIFCPYIFHFMFFMVVFTFCGLNTNLLEVIGKVDRDGWLALVWQMAGIPALTALGCFLLNADLLTTAVLIATTTAGSVFASPAIANLVGLDRRLSMRTMFLTTLAMPISLLFFGELTGILPDDLPLNTYVNHVVFFLLVPIVLAIAYWEVQPRLERKVGPIADRTLNLAATLALMGFCVGVMHEIHGTHAPDPEHRSRLLFYVFLNATIVTSTYVVTGLVFAHLGRRASLTVGLLAANRNVALSFALIGGFLPGEALAYVAVAQFPIFLAPICIRAVRGVRRTVAGTSAA